MNTQIINGDVLDVLRTLPDESVDLILADPPYNIGIDYGTGAKADRRGDYHEWCEAWINACWRVLSRTGSIWIISGQEHGAEIDLILQQHFTMRNRITWHETFGVYCHNKFWRCSRPEFYAVKDPKRFCFNRDAVTIPSARQEKYGDRRAAAGGKIMGDVWEISRVCGTFKERIKGVPTQLPAELVSRIIRVSSNEGDTVLDPFVGSGTTLAVAKSLGRGGVGIEINPDYCEIAESRVSAILEPPKQLALFS
jgi:site-specific DNA-methyltransferase (adenine-specific)